MATSARLIALLGASGVCWALAVARRLPAEPPQGGCGPASLQAVCSRLGVPATVQEIDLMMGGASPLSSLGELKSAAVRLGLKAEGIEMTVAELGRARPLGVLHVDGGHFVALVGYAKAGPRVADPILPGKVPVSIWPYDHLSERWDGRILVVAR